MIGTSIPTYINKEKRLRRLICLPNALRRNFLITITIPFSRTFVERSYRASTKVILPGGLKHTRTRNHIIAGKYQNAV